MGSGTVGPEAIVDRSSPTTSESTSVTTRAGAAARARPPPLSHDRCLRTAFVSWIVAPARRRSAVVRALSSSVTPSAGEGRSADAPPESSTSSRSSRPRSRASASTSAAAARPRASGTGWLAVRSCTRSSGPCAAVETASPADRRSPSTSSAARAIGTAALPTATIATRPRPSRWRTPAASRTPARSFSWRRTRRWGSAATSASRRMACAAARRRARLQRAVNAAAAGRGRSGG